MEHYFHGIYDKKDISDKLKDLGFTEEDHIIHGVKSTRYISGFRDFIIELTSPEEGKIQIQGEGPADIHKNDILSKYYEFYKKIITELNPEKVTNSKSEIFYQR